MLDFGCLSSVFLGTLLGFRFGTLSLILGILSSALTSGPCRRYECPVIDLKIADPDLAEKVANGGVPLRDLCRQEVDKFDTYLRGYSDEYVEGLARFERLAIEGYIYQKVRGRFDGQEKEAGEPCDSGEHQDGATASS